VLHGRLQFDQHALQIRKDKHISPPASKVGGAVVLIGSLIRILNGRRVCNAAFGCKFITAEPQVGIVGVVSPDTVEALLLATPLLELPELLIALEDSIGMRPGTIVVDPDFFG
jgi:hypothetical protein